jgi:hypothetical protein
MPVREVHAVFNCGAPFNQCKTKDKHHVDEN